jgi:uncharacterized protein YndB with AHSA1/START domain
MTPLQHDWTKFCKRIPVKASVQEIYDAWSTQAGLEKWFLRKAEFTISGNKKRDRNSPVQKGDRYEWLWHGYPDDVSEKKEILEANGKDFIQFKFSGDCTVSVRVKQEQGETITELVQENIPPDDNPLTHLLVGCGEGWTFYLANLKSVLEGGLDLRNRNEKIKSVINS